MIIVTNTADRKQLAKEVGEWLRKPVHYDRLPNYTYSIGAVTIDRSGSISCEDEEVWAELTPFFREHGWMPEENEETEPMGTIGPDPERSTEHEADSEAVAETEPGADSEAATEADSEADSEAEPVADSEADSNSEAITGTCVSIPFGEATAANLINLLRTLYARQKLIGAMTQSDKLFIDEEVITLLNDTKPDTREKVAELLEGEIHVNMVRGISFADERISIEFPRSEDEPARWRHYANLLIAIVNRALGSHHVSTALLEPAETEMKYYCNSWLMQLGFGGHENKEARAVLMGHLKGFAAFRTADKMDAHKAKLAEHRIAARQMTEGNTNEADR